LIIVNILGLLIDWMSSGHVVVVLGARVVLAETVGVCVGMWVVNREGMVVQVPIGWLGHWSEDILFVVDKLKGIMKRLIWNKCRDWRWWELTAVARSEIFELGRLTERDVLILKHFKRPSTLRSLTAVPIARSWTATSFIVSVASRVRVILATLRLSWTASNVGVHSSKRRSCKSTAGALMFDLSLLVVIVKRTGDPPLPLERPTWCENDFGCLNVLW
jgi:hypothetical protein